VKSTFQSVIGGLGSDRHWLAPAGIFTLTLLLSACASTSYDMQVHAAAKPTAKAAISYRIESNDPALDPSSLRYKEAENFVKTALSGKGMYEAPKPELADMVVVLDYGIGPPIMRQKAISEPVYQNIPGSTTSQIVQSGSDIKGNPIYTTVVTQTPSRQDYIGDREFMTTITTYEKRLVMTARENKEGTEGKAPKPVWGVQVTSEDESKDMRKYLPVLIAASIEYIGKDSGGEIQTIRVKEQDPAIAFVKKGL
jgi:hypothetical protein